jgi:hypothetical protein
MENSEENSDVNSEDNSEVKEEKDMARRKLLEVTTDMPPSEEDKKTKMEEQEKEAKAKEEIIAESENVPDEIKKIIESTNEELKSQYKTAIDRLTPLYTKDGIKLRTGELIRYPSAIERDEVIKIAEEMYGGGLFAWRLMDGRSRQLFRLQFRIPGIPKPTQEEIDAGGPTTVKPDGSKIVSGEGGVEKIERQQKELEAKLELKKTEKKYDKEIKKLEQEEDEGEEDESLDMSRFSRSPDFLEFMQQRRQSPEEIEERVKAKLTLENENRELKNRIAAMEAKLDTLQEKDNKPGLDTKKILEIIGAIIPLVAPIIIALKPEKRDPVEDFKKIADAIGINKSTGLDQTEMMRAGMGMLTDQMSASQKMLMSQMQTTLETSMEILKKSMLDMSGVKEPGDWRVELGAKALEAGQVFVKEIVGYNKERLGVEKSKLDMIRNRQIKPITRQLPQKSQQVGEMQPKNNIAPVTPEQTIETPVTEQKTELSEEEKDIAKKINTEANALLTAMKQGYIGQATPEMMVDKTPELVGDTVMSYLLQCKGLEDIRELAKMDGKAELFDKYIMGMPDVKMWVERYLDLLKKTYEMTDEEVPVENVGEEKPEN